MTREEAKIIIGNIPINEKTVDHCYSVCEYQEAKTMAIKALEQVDKIEHIIAIDNSVIQEDVLKYKMICEVLI